MESGVLECYRTLGLVCDDKAFKWHREGENSYISLPIGKSFLTYNHETLRIRYMGCQLEKVVNSLDTYKDLILLASGNTVSAFHKVKIVKKYSGSSSSISEILVFGEYLLGLNYSSELLIWNCEDSELLNTFALPGEGTHIVHPPTYLNKVLISIKNSLLWLINIKTAQKIYDFPNITKEITGEIICLENAVALDIIGIGCKTGCIIFANILKDEIIFRLEQNSPVTSLSVCSHAQTQILATGTENGFFYIWDLENKRIKSKVKAHANFKVTKVFFTPNEALLTTCSGSDNSIKQWIFDFDSPEPRLYKSREGFNASPKYIRFYNSNNLLACSNSTLRDLSILNEHQSAEFSSKHAKKSIKKLQIDFKIPEFQNFAFSASKQRDWCSIISSNGTYAYLWDYESKIIGEKPIERRNQSSITSVSVSECGNFGVLGFSNGTLEKFNMQSGLHQFTFKSSHNSEVCGIEIDGSNAYMVSTSVSGELFYWDFFTGGLVRHLKTSKIHHIRLQKFSNLLGVCSDNQVNIFDIRTLKLARSFLAEDVKDISFSCDSRWISICEKTGIKIWDIPSARLIDWVCFKNNPVSLDFSPDGKYLATAHENSLGVFLWLNKAYYTNVIINKSPVQPRNIKGFDVSKGKNFYSRKLVKIQNLDTKPLDLPKESIINLKLPGIPSHLTFKTSEVPYNRILALYHLDEIKERNAPVQPPKKPEKVPFFLPDSLGIITADVDLKSDENQKNKIEDIKEKDLSYILDNNTESIFQFLISLSPGKLELNLLGLSDEEVPKFIEFLYEGLKLQKNFDFLQSILSCFLKLHSDKISKNQALELSNLQTQIWENIEKLFIFDISGLERLID